jgi:hypothetical protein
MEAGTGGHLKLLAADLEQADFSSSTASAPSSCWDQITSSEVFTTGSSTVRPVLRRGRLPVGQLVAPLRRQNGRKSVATTHSPRVSFWEFLGLKK